METQTVGTFTAIGAVIMPPRGRGQRGEPVRRHSYLKGREGTLWRSTSRKGVSRLVLAAKRFERERRGKGKRNGPLGAVALEVIELLGNLVDYRTGRLDPSLATIMRMLKRSRDAVVRALANLRRHGFLDWIRRFEPTGNETGPQVRQASNAYRLCLPKAAEQALGDYGKEPPPPDDHVHMLIERQAEYERMTAQLTLPELARHKVETGSLADALARLGSALIKRESAKRSESNPTSISIGANAPVAT